MSYRRLGLGGGGNSLAKRRQKAKICHFKLAKTSPPPPKKKKLTLDPPLSYWVIHVSVSATPSCRKLNQQARPYVLGRQPTDQRIELTSVEDPSRREAVGTLRVLRLGRYDDGLYVCIASNEVSIASCACKRTTAWSIS